MKRTRQPRTAQGYQATAGEEKLEAKPMGGPNLVRRAQLLQQGQGRLVAPEHDRGNGISEFTRFGGADETTTQLALLFQECDPIAALPEPKGGRDARGAAADDQDGALHR